MNELQRKEIQEAIEAADNALYHLDNARRYLGSAGNWDCLICSAAVCYQV